MSGTIRIAFSVILIATVLTALVSTLASMSGIPLQEGELALTAGVSLLVGYWVVKGMRKLKGKPAGEDES